MTSIFFPIFRSMQLSGICRFMPVFLLVLPPFSAIAQGYSRNPGGAQGEAFFIEPNSPRDNEDIVIHYPRRGCSDGRVDAQMKGKETLPLWRSAERKPLPRGWALPKLSNRSSSGRKLSHSAVL
jgi:hypothetical protein